jgi:capsular polysaccharide biosynthesis protein
MELTKTLRKRWALTTTLLILTLIATGAALVKLPWSYKSTADVMFLPSNNLAKSYGGNLFLAFNSTINETADVVRYEATDAHTAQALAAAGDTQGYTIADALDTSAPILVVTVTGSNAGAVEHTLTGVVNKIAALLASQQSGFSPVNQIHDTVLSFDSRANRVTSKKARPLLVVFAIGLLFTVAIPVLVDSVEERQLTLGRAAREQRGSQA